jgi:hypothetical protein
MRQSKRADALRRTSIRWVRLSRWRTPLSLGVNASLIVAAISFARVV